MKVKNRKSKRVPERDVQKITETSEPDYDKEHPLFSFKYLSSGFCIFDCDRDDKAAFADTLRKLSQLTWEQLAKNDRHKLGFELIPKDQIRATAPPYFEGETKFMVFRFNGMMPMLGVRMKNIYHVIWIDKNHKIYS